MRPRSNRANRPSAAHETADSPVISFPRAHEYSCMGGMHTFGLFMHFSGALPHFPQAQEANESTLAPRIDSMKRARIVDALKAGGKLAQIARAEGVSPSAVKSIRIAEGMQPIASPEQRESAAKARDLMLVEARRRRAELMVSLLSDAERLRQQLFTPTTVYAFGGKENEYAEHLLAEPDARAKQSLLIGLGIAIDKSLTIEKYDQESTTAAKAAIIDLVDRLTGSGDDLAEAPSEEDEVS